MDIAQIAVAIAMGAALTAIVSFFMTFIRNSMLATKGEITVVIKKGGHTIEILNPTTDQIDKLLRQLRDLGENNHFNPLDRAVEDDAKGL